MKLSLKEIEDLISNNRLIIIRKNLVYDITNFNNHPGGINCLIKKTDKKFLMIISFIQKMEKMNGRNIV